MYIVFADRFGQILCLCWIFNFMRYGDWGIYRIKTPWEILQSFLQESDDCSVSAGSQDPIFIFICRWVSCQLQWLTVGFKQIQGFFFFRQNYAVVTLVHCAQSLWTLHFLSETKITFLGIIFVQILQNIASIRNRERRIICTLPELYRLFFKTQACACFIGIYNKLHTYIFQDSL
jgi:hypothetical protein